MPDRITNIEHMTDRELVIELRTWMVGMRSDINDLRAAVNQLERELSQKYVTRDEFEPFVEEMKKQNDKHDDKYVRRDEFEPIKNLVYGAVGLILTAVVLALVYLVVNAPAIP